MDQGISYTPPVVDDGTGRVEAAYNLDKQLSSLTHDQGSSIGFIYDQAGRFVTRSESGNEINISYDSVGRVNSLSTSTGESLSYAYDGPLQTRETYTGTVTGSVAISYDSDFRVTRHTINNSHSLEYEYDRDGLLTQAGDLALTRDEQNGLLTGTSLGKVTTEIEYNGFGELLKETALYDGNIIYETTYTRNKLGRITEITESIDGVTSSYGYTYDETGRLIEERTNGTLTGSWEYDANNNRITLLSLTTGDYDNQDRLLRYANAERNLPDDDTEISYVIDAKDRRIGRTENGELKKSWLFADQLNPIAELDDSGTVDSLFIYGEKGHSPSAMKKDGQLYRILSDHLGSPRIVVNSSTGEIVQRIDYDVWGVMTLNSNPTFQSFGFAGGLHDQLTGLVRFGVRDYDPVSGRWMGKDPIGFAGGDTNLFGYVQNDPVNWVDPDGKEPATVIAIVAGVWIGAYIAEVGDMISDPQGNLYTGTSPQDWECSLGSLTPIANACLLDRCITHDQCFELNECNYSSWIPSLLGGTKACNQCNSDFF